MNQPLAPITSIYHVSGLHCASCEILIEKRLIKLDSVLEVDVSLAKGTLYIKHYPDSAISPKSLNRMFAADGYRFSLKPLKAISTLNSHCLAPSPASGGTFTSLFIGFTLIIGYLLLARTGLSSLISVNSQSSLVLFFLFGVLAGLSSCAALVGGIILSLSQQWLQAYNPSDSIWRQAQPHFLFNTGRVLGYAFFGAILGAVGNFFQLSPLFTAILVISISALMILLGLQMVGVKSLQNFQIRLPKSITGKVANESNFTGRFGPLLMGALTFFLPCGFTITTQALALTSGNPLQGSLIMGLFAFGTVPGLMAIGLSSVKLQSNPATAQKFSLVAGMLVLFFAIFNINSQLAVLGLANINDLMAVNRSVAATQASSQLPPLVNGVQVVKIEASSYAYTPNRLRLRANTPTRWEITDTGTSGCTNAIISRGLFEGQIDLTPGRVSVKEFTSPKPGVYKFSCWMGMVTGTVEVVDSSGSTGESAALPVESGAKGCGCGGGSGSTCGMH
jgi:sulfite exporter TauE/SafE/copper chaperone CopZ